MISNVLVTSMLLTSVSSFAAPVSGKAALVQEANNSNGTFKILLSNYKKAVFQDGRSNDEASKDLINALVASNMKVEDVKAYALATMSTENYLSFSRTLSKGLNGLDGKTLSAHKVKNLVTKLIESESREGAQWLSCEVGLGVGIPLMVAGIVTGIVALSMKRIQVSAIEKKYIDQRNEALLAYTNAENDRQDDIVAYESDIAAYQNAIAELQRKIDSGAYGSLETEKFRQDIAVLNVNISDARADIAQLVNDQPQLYQSFQNQLANLDKLETNEVASSKEEKARKDASKKTLGVVSAIAIPAGLALVLSARDC